MTWNAFLWAEDDTSDSDSDSDSDMESQEWEIFVREAWDRNYE